MKNEKKKKISEKRKENENENNPKKNDKKKKEKENMKSEIRKLKIIGECIINVYYQSVLSKCTVYHQKNEKTTFACECGHIFYTNIYF